MAYQDGDILVRATMSNVNGNIEDAFVNDFSFTQSLPQTEAQFLELTQRVDDFYNVVGASTFRVSQFISDSVARTVSHRIDMYRIQAGPLGSPIFSTPWLGPSANIVGSWNLPNEVAAVVSFHSSLSGVLEEAGATRPRARRRGRLFIGPLIVEAMDQPSPNPGLNPVLCQAMREGIGRLMDSNDDADSGGSFGVWSRKDAVVRVVDGGWTDLAPDTQRRRGQKTLARITFGA